MVILPEFQGLGLGPKLSEAVAQKFLDEGYRYLSVTAHPSLGERRQSSSLWKPVSGNMEVNKAKSWRSDDQVKRTLPKKSECVIGTNTWVLMVMGKTIS